MKRYDLDPFDRLCEAPNGALVYYDDVQAERLLLAKAACGTPQCDNPGQMLAAMELAQRIVEGGGA